MLSSFTPNENGISLMSNTGVTEADILTALFNFTDFMEDNHGKKDPIDFVTKKHMSHKTIKAFALLGIKAVISEYNTMVNTDDKKDKESSN